MQLADVTPLALMVSACATSLASIAAWLSALSARRNAEAVRRNTEAQLVHQMLLLYSSDDMHSAILGLKKWTKDVGFFANRQSQMRAAERFAAMRLTDSSFHILDGHRRLVSHYFQNIVKLHTARYLSEMGLKTVLREDQVRFFRHVIEPIDEMLDDNADKTSWEFLGRLYNVQPWRWE